MNKCNQCLEDYEELWECFGEFLCSMCYNKNMQEYYNDIKR
jgi:hypothetical protein